jgi:hypothetical protein
LSVGIPIPDFRPLNDRSKSQIELPFLSFGFGFLRIEAGGSIFSFVGAGVI